jgi:Glutamate-cysteine ligase family 2(GCS2)
MSIENRNGFHFGLETEFLLVDSASFRPLWHTDLKFKSLNAALEEIPADEFKCDSFKVEPPHRKPGPYIVEGYHLPDPEMRPIDLLPKGVEIRTPICSSIEDCLAALNTLHARLQHALAELGYRAAALSFHPTEVQFSGPQNKRRHDFWQWAMEAMVTYGPDVNVSVPKAVAENIDLKDLNKKVNYYAPALTALSVASPLRQGELWRIRGRVGKSVRTYHRSAIAPAVEIHPDEGLRLEFKPFEMSTSLTDYRNYFLLWLALILDTELKGRASDQTRIYDLGKVACSGVQAETVLDRANEVLSRAPQALDPWGFDCGSLKTLRARLETGHLPADEIIGTFEREKTIEGTLRHRCELH